MKPTLLTALAVLVGVAGCRDAVTSPQVEGDLQYGLLSNPPPPPIDTGATGRFIPAADLRAPSAPGFLQPRYSIVGAPSTTAFDFQQDEFFFALPVLYTLNTRGDAGALQFIHDKTQTDFTIADGKIKWDKGDFFGKGTIQIQTTEGLVVIDVSSINDAESYFERCGDGFTPGQRCFHVVFDRAWFYPTGGGGPFPGSAEMDTGCSPASQETEACFSEE